jgi:type IX secretion system PorP/SprF family membrane protein
MFRFCLYIIGCLFCLSKSYAQDTQLSQYYHAPLYLNPAFAGSGLDTRVGVNYRVQWPGLNDPFKSYAVWADHDFYKLKSGVGMMIKKDVQGDTKLKSTDISAFYSYQINITDRWTIKPALQAGIGFRNFDFSSSVFGDQLTNNGQSGNPTNDPLYMNGRQFAYPDLSVGTVAYNSNVWIGFAANHLNRPNQSFDRNTTYNLPIKWSIIGGYKIVLMERQVAWGAPIKETSITPSFLYKAQGEADQLDAGIYWIHHPFMAGLWYRGIPVKKYGKGISNSESIIAMVGISHNQFTFGYSYDISLSQLSGLSGGAHELAIVYQWLSDKSNKKGKKGHRPMPCPNLEVQFKRNTF